MAAVFSFGSFGDLISVVQIAYSLAQALRDTGTASQECKDLVDYLTAFGQNMNSLKQYVSRSGPHVTDQSSALQVYEALASCERLMQDFKARYVDRKEPTGRRVNDMIKRARWAIRWVLSANEDAAELRQRLMSLGDIITRMLSLSIWVAVKDDQRQLRELTSIVRVARSGDLPPDVNYQSIVLIDALNEKRYVPLEVCRTRQDFESFLKIYYAHRAGKTFLERDYYLLETAEGKSLQVGGNIWNSRMKAGTVVQMTVCSLSYDVQPGLCPSCKARNPFEKRDLGKSIRCSYCATTFRIATSSWEISRVAMAKLSWMFRFMQSAPTFDTITQMKLREALSAPPEDIVKPLPAVVQREQCFIRNVVIVPVTASELVSIPFSDAIMENGEIHRSHLSGLFQMIQWMEILRGAVETVLSTSSGHCSCVESCKCNTPCAIAQAQELGYTEYVQAFESLQEVDE